MIVFLVIIQVYGAFDFGRGSEKHGASKSVSTFVVDALAGDQIGSVPIVSLAEAGQPHCQCVIDQGPADGALETRLSVVAARKTGIARKVHGRQCGRDIHGARSRVAPIQSSLRTAENFDL